MKSKPLRFAGLVRVSTPGQRDEGASLETQKGSIERSVEQLGGNSSSIKWYAGQEHSTENYERKICDRLLTDAKKKLFDAVICYDLSRWSRDNLRSKTNLEILRKNGIEFYEGNKKYDLSNYDDTFIIGMMTEINERAAKEIKSKMMEGKITRAEEGWAVCNYKSLPWGREFDNDKKNKDYANVYDRWTLKDGAKEQMNEIVDRYIDGEKTAVLAKELDLHPSNLLVLFRDCLGNRWKRTFFSLKRNKEIVVNIPMPALIDDKKKIEKVIETIASKRTWAHGSYTHDYLFSSMIFDKKCGHTLTGSTKKTTKGELRYYFHQDNYKKCLCGSRKYIPEKALEVAVLSELFYMYEDDAKIEEAVLRAFPDQGKFKKLIAEDASDSKELMKIQRQEDRIVERMGNETISDEVGKRTLNKYRERKEIIESKIEERKPLLQNLPPSKKELEAEVEFIKEEMDLFRRIMSQSRQTPGRISRMSFADKRRLMELAFGDKDVKGNRLGIYLEQGATKKDIKYEIRGKFSRHSNYKEQISGKLPMQRWKIQELLSIDTDEEGDITPFDEAEIKRMELKKQKRKKFQYVRLEESNNRNQKPCKAYNCKDIY